MEKISTYYLHPGTVFYHPREHLVSTILGSCVAVCIYDKRLKTGGMNHFMLPLWNGVGLESPRYGNIALTRLYDMMCAAGSQHGDLICKVFGGAGLIDNTQGLFNVGARNVEIAYNLLNSMQLPVVSASTGGNAARRIWFNSGTGDVFQKYLIRAGEEKNER